MLISPGIWPSLSPSSRVLRPEIGNMCFLEPIELVACVSCGASNLRVTWPFFIQSTNERGDEYGRNGMNT